MVENNFLKVIKDMDFFIVYKEVKIQTIVNDFYKNLEELTIKIEHRVIQKNILKVDLGFQLN